MYFMLILLEGIQWLYFVALPIIGAMLLIVALVLVIRSIKKNKFLKQRETSNVELINYLGGRDNIISSKAAGSRLALVLKDYSLIDDEQIKRLGVERIIKMSNKVTLLIGEEDAKKIDKIISNQ